MLCVYYDKDQRKQCHSEAEYAIKRVRDGHIFSACATHARRVLNNLLEVDG